MIYFDSAATSYQKPHTVRESVLRAMNTAASPGRGAHAPAMRAANYVYNCRSLLADFFNVSDPEKVVFTCNATHALNIAIASLVKPGDKVLVSGFEHNSVTRPLHALGADICVAKSALFDPQDTFKAFEAAISGAKCVVCTHVSNVFGYILPIEAIAELCVKRGVPLIIDASQSAGVLPLDFQALGADFIAMPGHKGLLGPQGTGVLLIKDEAQPIIFGGTGSHSREASMPDFLPDRLEAGTHNVPCIAGLNAGVQFVQNKGLDVISSHERTLMRHFADLISSQRRLRIFLAPNADDQSGVLSMTCEGLDCEVLAEELGKSGICVRAGMHCAPLAHQSAGTLVEGTVRFSFSPFNTYAEVSQAAKILKKITNVM